MKIFLRSQGYELRLSDRDYRRLATAFLQGFTKTVQNIALRDEGEVVEPEVLAPASSLLQRPTATQVAAPISWEQLFKKWRLATVRKPKTADEFHRILKTFESFVGGLTPVGVTKRHVIDFRDHLLSENQSSKTVDKKISILRTIFRVAVHDEMLPTDPTAGVLVAMPKVAKKPRTAFTTDELHTIFGAQLFQAGAVANRKFGPAEYWLPLIPNI